MLRFLMTFLIVTGMTTFTFMAGTSEKTEATAVNIRWTDKLKGDFSFKDHWNYPEGIYINGSGQLSCDGLCPPGTDRMIDEKGNIYKDSLEAFYRLVDTAHMFHSIRSDAWCYEWAGTNFVTAAQTGTDTVTCFTHTTASTHCSLQLIITKDKCIPFIEVNSVSDTATKIYVCKSGRIEIDRSFWNKGILKAKFDFTFDPKEDPGKPMYWRGAIYAGIEQERNK